MATYGPEIDQSQHAKSVSHIINTCMLQIYSVEHSYGLGGESLRATFTISTVCSSSTLATPQSNRTMCNRTSCAQVHKLP